MEPVFLTLAEVLEIHRDQLERYGGRGGIRDVGLLQSAVAAPSAGMADGYLRKNVFAMAAAYLVHINRNHPFLDGNKRTGIVSALVFLALNDISMTASEDDLEKAVLAVAEGKWDEARVEEFFRQHSSAL